MDFEKNVSANNDIKFECDRTTRFTFGNRNAEITYQLQAWNKQIKLGKVFDSSTEFKLPNGAFRSPDAAWISLERWNELTPKEQEKFPPLAPDFVIELRKVRCGGHCVGRLCRLEASVRRGSPRCSTFSRERSRSDRLKPLQEKMQEYINNGVRLGWLIDPQNRQVAIYRRGSSVEIVRMPKFLSGEGVLPEFVLDLNEIW